MKKRFIKYNSDTRRLMVFPVLLSLLMFTFCTKEVDVPDREVITTILTNKISADSIESTIVRLEAMGTRFSLAENRKEVALELQKRFISMGYLNASLDSFLITRAYRSVIYTQWQYNVSATIEGSVYPDSVCVVGAHYDNTLFTGDTFSIVPGANDNASGVALTLELARVMKEIDYKPQNTIEFIAFAAEEIGLFGSINYVTNAYNRGKKVKLMLNNDMVAWQPSTGDDIWKVNIMDYDNSHNLRLEAEILCSKYTRLGYINDNTHSQQSDSYPFFVAGYKALFFFSGTTDPNYHTLNDLAVNCNFEYCSEIAKLACSVLVYNN